MIFATGLVLFVCALVVSLAEAVERHDKAYTVVAAAGVGGLFLMLVSCAIVMARWMP